MMTLEIGSKGIMTVLIVVAALLFIALMYLLYLRFSKGLFREVFRRPEPMPKVDRSPQNIDQRTIFGRGRNWFYTNRMEYINVRIDSFDRTKLSGYYRPSADRQTKFAVICLHDYKDHPSVMSAYAKLMMRQLQCHVLITHMRAHCMSGGKYLSHGVYESVDLMRWIDFIRQQAGNDVRIFVVGRGMGATTALIAAQQREFQDNVCGIIADCPYDTLENALMFQWKKRFPLNPMPLIKMMNMLMTKQFGFGMDKCDALTNATKIRVPVLVFEAGNDTNVPPDGAQHIYDDIRTPKRLVVVDNARHCMCYDKATAVFEREVRKFVEQCVVRLVSMGKM